MMSLAAVNAFVTYHEIDGNGSFLDFLVDMCRCLYLLLICNTQITSITNPMQHLASVQRSLKADQVPKDVGYVLTNVATGQFSATSLNGVNTMVARDALGSAVQNVQFTFV